MQRIVCWFLFHVHKNVHVSSKAKKLPLSLLVSPAFFTARPLGEIHIIPSASLSLTVQHLAVWFYTLQ